MVTVFGILNLTEDSFFDESRRLDPAGAVTAAIEMLRVGSDVVDVGPPAIRTRGLYRRPMRSDVLRRS
uniref:Pterin-binding domain-containing protein n=1 Tax=Escherichia coli TaxID=562 RepID=A0A809SZR6_ECOLX|nr:hypothetical protein [Escherichia coli]